MNENNSEFPLPESHAAESPVLPRPAPAPVKPKSKIPIVVWIGGCGILLFMCAVVIVAGIYFGLPFLQGDPIVSLAPNDSMMYMGVDLSRTQSQDFADIVAIVQEMSDQDSDKTMAESLDEFMDDELNMSFTEDVAPWLGRYGALVVTEGDFSSNDAKFMLILQSRDQNKTDEFMSKFVTALEKQGDSEFEKSETDGITFYIDEADSEYDEDVVMARNGKFVYLSNSKDTVLDSVNLDKKDSLGRAQSYKDALAVLPKNRLATVFVGSDMLSQAFTSLMDENYGLGYPSYMQDMIYEGVTGVGMSLSVEKQGLRMDASVVYNEKKLTDYQKEMLATNYLAPTTAALLPKDTFIFVGSNSSQTPGSYTEVDNPLYSSDVQESFDLLEEQMGINFQEFVDLLGNEFAVAVGPANDGLLAEQAEIDLGFTILAGTNDEAAFVDWFEHVLNKFFKESMYMEYDVEDTAIGDYSLKELSIPDGPSGDMFGFVYGADNGFIVLGTSPSMLEQGLTSQDTLANNEIYRQTWSAFPANSVPYIYFNVEGFMNFMVDNADEFGSDDMRDAQEKLRKIPVVAMSMNNTEGNVQSTTIIIFIDKTK